jgi:hypothetical protein
LAQKVYEGNKPATDAANHLLDGFCDWIDAGHIYRHGQKADELEMPPIDFSVATISSGASYLHWLVTLNQAAGLNLGQQ